MLGASRNALPVRELGDIDAKAGALRSLATGRGIRLGDGPSKLRSVMGSPTWTGGSKLGPGERVWTYHRKVGTDEDEKEYVSLFRLRKGRITCIELRYDLVGDG